MLKRAFSGSELDFPAGVEVITAWENDICMMLEENTTQMTEGYQGTVDKRSIERHRRRHERRELSEADTVIPNVQCAVALDFAEDTVRGAGEVMGCLEHMRDLLWDGDREDEEISVPHV
jgi:hypothetical protein